MYVNMLEGIDAIDNGIEIADEVRFREGTGLSSRIARLNPRWNEPRVAKDAPEGEHARFEVASALAGTEFSEQLDGLVNGWLPARDLVEAALLKRAEVDVSGEIICFESGGMPWKQHLYELERVHNVEPIVKFVLYTDQAGMWRVQAVTVEGTAFANRLSLPEEWRGLRDEELSGKAGIEKCTWIVDG